MTTNLTSKVIAELNKYIDPTYNLQQFFKHPITYIGVRSSDIRKVAKSTYPKDLSKEELLKACTELLEYKITEHSMVALRWADAAKETFTKDDFAIFEKWLDVYITNWGLCDSFAPYVLSDLLIRYPSLMQRVRKWTKSENPFVRRASAVIYMSDAGGVKPTVHTLDDVFWIVTALLHDEEDIVQKGSGWLLKNASIEHEKEVFDFVIKHKKEMSRTTLRYAIERMSKDMKKQAMK